MAPAGLAPIEATALDGGRKAMLGITHPILELDDQGMAVIWSEANAIAFDVGLGGGGGNGAVAFVGTSPSSRRWLPLQPQLQVFAFDANPYIAWSTRLGVDPQFVNQRSERWKTWFAVAFELRTNVRAACSRCKRPVVDSTCVQGQRAVVGQTQPDHGNFP
eukprot:284350-Prymnesium_polylepis.2